MQKEKAHILIADDEHYIRSSLKTVLEGEGYQVTVAYDGVECLGLVRKNDYDVVFLDIKMPRLDGVETLKSIMAFGFTTQVIMICGFANQETVNECIEMGAVGFLHKPLDLNMLLAALNVGLAIREEKKRTATSVL